MTDDKLRIFQIETLSNGVFDIAAVDRATALAQIRPGVLVLDCKDKTAKRAHERERED